MPTPTGSPCPRDPVARSIPGTHPGLGCSARQLPASAKVSQRSTSPEVLAHTRTLGHDSLLLVDLRLNVGDDAARKPRLRLLTDEHVGEDAAHFLEQSAQCRRVRARLRAGSNHEVVRGGHCLLSFFPSPLRYSAATVASLIVEYVPSGWFKT